uniref:SET domain-containing protein n=1 Tax=Oryza meridionalis TaxID=40149 RepID=A0A0E0EM27_9ORYZ
MINSPRILPRPRRRLPAARPPLPRGAETVITSPRILPRPRRRLPAARPPLPRGAAAVIDSLRILPRPRGRLSPARPPLPRGAAAVITSPRILPRPRRRLSAALPPRPRGAAAPPPAAAVAVTDEGGVGPRRSFRISLRPRVRVVPWVKPPVARKPKDPAKSPRPSIEALAAEWAKEKAASGAPEEECVLPFLQKGAPKKEAFRRLPLPHTFQEFSIDPIKKEELDNGTEPPPYKIKIIPTGLYWLAALGLVTAQMSALTNHFAERKRLRSLRALEAIEKDDFVIEFVGEVIDDETCEERLEDMRRRGDKNFYMCKVKKDFVIDATFKGNDCRFFNHSCEPNCQLQKWQVNGKTRLGVFASKAIEVGEPLTYDYRFEQHFGPEIECFCGAQNCQGNMSVSGKD